MLMRELLPNVWPVLMVEASLRVVFAVLLGAAVTATVLTGTSPHGQGHATVFAQIAADILDVPIEHVTVISADTARFPRGIGTIGSRIAVRGGSSVHIAATRVKDKALKVAAEMLEAGEADLALDGGRVRVAGTDRSVIVPIETRSSITGAARARPLAVSTLTE